MPSIPIDGTRPVPRPRAPGPVASPMPSSTGPRPTVRPRKPGGGSGPFIPQGPVFRGRGGRDFNVGDDLFNSIPQNQRALAQRTFRAQGIGGLTDRFAAEPWSGQLVAALRGAQQNGTGSRPVAEMEKPVGPPLGAAIPNSQQDTNPQPQGIPTQTPDIMPPPDVKPGAPINPAPPPAQSAVPQGGITKNWRPNDPNWIRDTDARLGAGTVQRAQAEMSALPANVVPGQRQAAIYAILQKYGMVDGGSPAPGGGPAPSSGQDAPGGPPVTYSPPINPGPIGVPSGLPPGPAYVPPVLTQDPSGVPNQPVPDIFGTYF